MGEKPAYSPDLEEPEKNTSADIDAYFKEVSQHSLLTKEEEVVLARRIKKGDETAFNKLVESNLRFVIKIAREYRTFGKVQDLIQEGNIGLMKAARKFDPDKGVRFVSYAAWWIRSQILNYLRDTHSMVKIATSEKDRRIYAGLRKAEKLLQKGGVMPTDEELADYFGKGVTPEMITEMRSRMVGDTSMDAPLSEDGNQSMHDVVEDDSDVREHEIDRFRTIEHVRKTLAEYIGDDRTRAIVEERLLDGDLTLKELGEQYGVSRERIRQLETKILEDLKVLLQKHQEEQEIPE